MAEMNRSAKATPSTASASAATTSDAQCTPSHTRLAAIRTASVHTAIDTDHQIHRRAV